MSPHRTPRGPRPTNWEVLMYWNVKKFSCSMLSVTSFLPSLFTGLDFTTCWCVVWSVHPLPSSVDFWQRCLHVSCYSLSYLRPLDSMYGQTVAALCLFTCKGTASCLWIGHLLSSCCLSLCLTESFSSYFLTLTFDLTHNWMGTTTRYTETRRLSSIILLKEIEGFS